MKTLENVKKFLRESYSDEALLALREQAKLGKLRRADSDHCLLGRSDAGYRFHRAQPSQSTARKAEREFTALNIGWPWGKKACKRLGWMVLPLIDQEICRRELMTLAEIANDYEEVFG
jgi:hypothetical protein